MSRRRLALVSLDWTRAKDPPLSLGHASILATLQAGRPHLTERIIPLQRSVIDPTFDPKHLAEEILSQDRNDFDVAFGCFVWNEADVKSIIAHLRNRGFNGSILLGGPQVSYSPSGCLEELYPEANAFIRGYAEEAMVSWMENPKGNIRGLHLSGTPDWGLQAQPNLEQLASPITSGTIPLQRFMRWETQRGCPFMCSFTSWNPRTSRLH